MIHFLESMVYEAFVVVQFNKAHLGKFLLIAQSLNMYNSNLKLYKRSLIRRLA